MKHILKRKKQGKTDYGARIHQLKSKNPRLVIRKSNRYIVAQIVESKEAQDKTRCYVHSKELEKQGWKSSFKNLPASYQVGKLIAKKAQEMKIKTCNLDIGRQTSTKGSRIYAVVKGALDSGLEIKCDKKMLPPDEKIQIKK